MDKKAASAFVKALGIKPEPAPMTDKGWLTFSCPMAEFRHESGTDKKPSCGIKYGTKRPLVHCLSCDYSADPSDLVREMKFRKIPADYKTAMRLAEAETAVFAFDDDEEEQFVLTPFPDDYLEGLKPAWGVKAAREYLQARDVPEAVSTGLGLLFDPDQRRIGFPIRDGNGTLFGFHGRTIVKDESLKYRMYRPAGFKTNSIVWLGEEWVDYDLPVVIVESVFDLARVYQVYRNVVCPLTASVGQQKILRLRNGYQFVHIADADKAGQRMSDKIRAGLPEAQHHVISLPPKRDPGDMTFQEIGEMLEDFVSLDEILS